MDLQLSIAHNLGLSKAIKTTQIAILPNNAHKSTINWIWPPDLS